VPHPTTHDVYWRLAEPAVRRALSLQDRNPASATYGCCDRSFWQYKTISSFAAATMQQLALPFAVLHSTRFDGNPWYGDEEMFERARSAMLFWAASQHASGSVDEWYRHEHSYCATAFTTFGIADACARLSERLAPEDSERILGALSRAAAWLTPRFNDDVMNQNLAACAALWSVHRLTGDSRWQEAFRQKWARTLEHQHREGWFVEYGGADLGYSLLALDLLAALYRLGCTDALPPATTLSRFIRPFAFGADVAGRLGSRGTDHSFAYGAEALAGVLPDASAVAAALRGALDTGQVDDPRTVDDRYLAYFYLPSFVMAASVAGPLPAATAAPATPEWSDSGFRIWRRSDGDVVCSARRCAAFNLYASPHPVHRNLGYWIETADGRRFATNAWSTAAGPGTAGSDAQQLTVEATTVRVEDQLPLVRHEVPFRAVSQYIFRWPSLAERFHGFIKRRKITRQTAGAVALRRELTWSGKTLIVRDRLTSSSGAPELTAIRPVSHIDVHSPSARMGGAAREHSIRVAHDTGKDWARDLNRSGSLTLVTTYGPGDDGRLRFMTIEKEIDSTPRRR
jgi:hypothetical protein